MNHYGPSRYEQYVKSLSEWVANTPDSLAARLFLVTGPDDYLVNRTASTLVTAWAARLSCPHESDDAANTNYEQLTSHTECRSLFDSNSIMLLRRSEKKSDLERFLADTLDLANSPTIFVIAYTAASAPAKLTREVTRLHGKSLLCFGPSLKELPRFIRAIAKRQNLTLSEDAIQTLIDYTGSDLSKLSNEVEKLALIFSARSQTIDANEIAPLLGVLREEDIFALDNLLLERKFSAASAVINQLMDRGESPIGINAILARHARHAILTIAEAPKCVSPRDFAQATGLPPFVAEKYAKSLRRMSAQPYQDMLQSVRNADLTLKSSPVSKDLILCQVLADLAHSIEHSISHP